MIFNQSKYTRIYYNIIQRAQTRILEGYVERHHIIPKCLGGSNEPSNIAILTPQEHYICHRLLVKMFDDDLNKMKMKRALSAFRASRPNQGRRLTARQYDTIRRETAGTAWNRGMKMSEEFKKKVSASRKGQPRNITPESLQSMIEKLKVRPVTQEHRDNLSKSLKGRPAPNKGKRHSLETIEKMRAAQRARHSLNKSSSPT